ncbi:hypothetical protein [Ktedonobacter sp. SOSP1-52]|uniref:hypothetical protein n=1 Tax=Ktedonobacter sp. SOSP1-52 TaxID=2778366 RepID=UPI001915B29E|nr:hypothetical protein [Ktedonobacter sp. SOSP1-52]
MAEEACGEARRIGYVHLQDHDFALYRLKIYQTLPPCRRRKLTTMLPGMFILDQGLFFRVSFPNQEHSG